LETTFEERRNATVGFNLKAGRIVVPVKIWKGLAEADYEYYKNTAYACPKCQMERNELHALDYDAKRTCSHCGSEYQNTQGLPRVILADGKPVKMLEEGMAVEKKTELTFSWVQKPCLKFLGDIYYVTSEQPETLRDLAKVLKVCFHRGKGGVCSLTNEVCTKFKNNGNGCGFHKERAGRIEGVVFKAGSEKTHVIVLMLDNDGELVAKEMIPENLVRIPNKKATRVTVPNDALEKLTEEDELFLTLIERSSEADAKTLVKVETRTEKAKQQLLTAISENNEKAKEEAKEVVAVAQTEKKEEPKQTE